jgi:hypothetical protein
VMYTIPVFHLPVYMYCVGDLVDRYGGERGGKGMDWLECRETFSCDKRWKPSCVFPNHDRLRCIRKLDGDIGAFHHTGAAVLGQARRDAFFNILSHIRCK